MINNFIKLTDTFYRIGVRLLYHSRVVAIFGIFSILILASTLNIYISSFYTSKNNQGFYVIDVGQGDSLLYISKENQTFLIDTGRPGNGIVMKLQKILGSDVKKIDVVLLTHPDSDHVGEIDQVLSSYNVGMILYSPIYDARDNSKKSIDDIKKKTAGKLTLPIFAGSSLSFSENEKAQFLSPSVSNMTIFTNKKEIAEDNYFSVVTDIENLSAKNKDIIFAMADAPQKIEKVLMNENFNLSLFDRIILKAGHHGSKTSSAPEFIKKISPTDVVLSYGLSNRYGHPHKETLDTIFSIPKIKIRRTVSGTVYFGE